MIKLSMIYLINLSSIKKLQNPNPSIPLFWMIETDVVVSFSLFFNGFWRWFLLYVLLEEQDKEKKK